MTRSREGTDAARAERRAPRVTWPTLVGVALLAVVAVLVTTRHGVGLSTDSVAYVDGARRLARGAGYSSGYSGAVGPITHWPPLYPMLLAALAALGLDPLAAARVVAPLLFGANVLLAGWLVRRHAPEAAPAAIPAAIAASLLVLVSADLLEVHTWLWSEPLFLILAGLAFHHLAVHLDGAGSRRRLAAAGALAGLGVLTRYVGVTVLLAGGLAVLLLGRARLARRVGDAALFGLVGAAPLALWMVRNRLVGGSSTGRALVVNPLGMEHLRAAARGVAAWLVPPSVPAGVRTPLLLAAVVALVALAVAARPRVARLAYTLAGFVVLYMCFVALSIALLDADVAFDARMLAPVHFLGVVLLGLVLAGAGAAGGARRAAWGAVAVVALLQAVHAARWARGAQHGLGYAGADWRESGAWRAIAALPAQVPVHSNVYDAIFIHTGRPAWPLPSKFNPNSRVADDDFAGRLAALRAALREEGGAVVYFTRESWRTYMPSDVELRAALAPYESQSGDGWTLYRVPR